MENKKLSKDEMEEEELKILSEKRKQNIAERTKKAQMIIENIKQNAVRFPTPANLNELVRQLAQLKEQNKNAYIVFHEEKLYSLFDDEASVYGKLLGCTKQEFENGEDKYDKNLKTKIETEQKENALNIYYNLQDKAIEYPLALDLGKTVQNLQKLKEENVNAYVVFSGNKFYSLIDDEDSCYKKAVGCTKQQWDKQLQDEIIETKKKQKEERERAEEEIPTWIEKGNALIYPEKKAKWKKCVNAHAQDIYYGTDVMQILAVMKAIESSSDFKKAKKVINDYNNSGFSYNMVLDLVAYFSKKGPDFYRYMEPEQAQQPKTKAYLAKIEKENKRLKAKEEKQQNKPDESQPGDN